MKSLFSISPSKPCLQAEWQARHSNFLALRVIDAVLIYNKLGELVNTIFTDGESGCLEWSPDGEYLAASQTQSSHIIIWESASRKKAYVQPDVKMSHVDFLCWSPESLVLVIGNENGNLVFRNFRESLDGLPLVGKHSKTITSGAWNGRDIVALASKDGQISISNRQGDTLKYITPKGVPSYLKWRVMADETKSSLFYVVGDKSIGIHQENSEKEVTLKYGKILSYISLDDQLVIAFETGYLVVVSSGINNFANETFKVRSHKDGLKAMAASRFLNQMATCGDSTSIKILDLTDLNATQDIITLEEERGNLETLSWSEDGQFLTVTLKRGDVKTFLAKLPSISNVNDSKMIWLSSVSDALIADQGDDFATPVKVALQVEPSVLAVGKSYFAFGLNNKVSFGKVSEPSANCTIEKSYASSIKKLLVSDQFGVALLSDGRIQIHEIAVTEGQRDDIMLPRDRNSVIHSACISKDFLVFGTDNGQLFYYETADWLPVAEYKHTCGIRSLYLSDLAVVFVDALNEGFVLNPVSEDPVKIPQWTSKFKGLIWSQSNHNLFLAWDDHTVFVYIYHPFSLDGPKCSFLDSVELPFNIMPVFFDSGIMRGLSPSGRLESVVLGPFNHLDLANFSKKHESEIQEAKSMLKLYYAGIPGAIWNLVPHVKSRRTWTAVAEAALSCLDLRTAKRIYQQILLDAGMVLTLNRLECVENRNELLGHIAVIFSQFDVAQKHFLASGNPREALILRQDLRHWEQALALAKTFSPQSIPSICLEYATELEYDGKYSDSCRKYETCLELLDPLQENMKECSIAGLIRTSLQLGDIPRGMGLLSQSTDLRLIESCSCILEGLKLYSEAAKLLETVEKWDDAANLWIKAKNWENLGKIIDRVRSLHVFSQFAKAREAAGNYTDAAFGYDRAKDYENLVRVLIDHVKDIASAVAVVRKTHSRESAKAIVNYFQEQQQYKPVIEFCIVAGLDDEAFAIAQQNDEMGFYAGIVKNDATYERLTQISTYFEMKNELAQAGLFMLHAGNYTKAVRLLIKSRDTNAIDLAIKAVGQAKNDAITHEVIDYLMGEVDGVPKDAKYIFKLYMALGQYKEAARTAIIIAKEEQGMGNYRAAHDLLLENYLQLRMHYGKIPAEIDRMLMIVHSYVLVKGLIRSENHYQAAQMLIRVSSNISKFTAHTVPILTSTVVECYRAGLKKAAFHHASILMRPEYRQKVDQKFKRKVEQIIRRPENDDMEEKCSACPFCNTSVPDATLYCEECKNVLPYCIATGRHMIRTDWSLCKNCHFPGLHSAMVEYVSNFSECPMCSFALSIHDIQKLPQSQATDCLRGKMEALEMTSAEDDTRTPFTILKRSTKNVVVDAPGVIVQDAAGLGGLVA